MQINIILNSQVIAEADYENRNRRIYSKKLLSRLVDEFKEKPKGSVLGHLGMPEKAMVCFNLVSHVIEDLRFENNKLVADIKILHTEFGKKLAELIHNGDVAFRLAGVGSGKFNSEGVFIIDEDRYKFISINAVSADIAS